MTTYSAATEKKAGAELAVDGKATTCMQTKSSTDAQGAWLTLDLSSVVAARTVVLANRWVPAYWICLLQPSVCRDLSPVCKPHPTSSPAYRISMPAYGAGLLGMLCLPALRTSRFGPGQARPTSAHQPSELGDRGRARVQGVRAPPCPQASFLALSLLRRSTLCGAKITTPAASHSLTCGKDAAGVQARFITLRIAGAGKVLSPCEVMVYGPGQSPGLVLPAAQWGSVPLCQDVAWLVSEVAVTLEKQCFKNCFAQLAGVRS